MTRQVLGGAGSNRCSL